jgi:hypothetical protein
MGGSISVKSTAGGGATFEIRIPVKTGEAPRPPIRTAVGAGGSIVPMRGQGKDIDHAPDNHRPPAERVVDEAPLKGV